MDRTPELPKARRTTSSITWDRKRPALFPPTRPIDTADNVTPGSATVQSGHSKPLQTQRFRRRLLPQQLSEIGELLKTNELDESE